MGNAGWQGKTDAARWILLGLDYSFTQVLNLTENSLRVLQGNFPGVRKGDPSTVAFKELDPQIPFELSEGVAQGWLGNV
ncbi:MAG: hypothetical protein VW039_01090 [Halieaceae bacterium]